MIIGKTFKIERGKFKTAKILLEIRTEPATHPDWFNEIKLDPEKEITIQLLIDST